MTAADAHAAYLSRRRWGSLDGLRAICILAVLWHHGPIWTGWEAAPQWATRGFLGVDMFFVLSGFLITSLLLRERDRTGTISLRGFYTRRARRILPPYLAVVGLVAIWFIGVQGRTDYLALLPAYLFFLANFLTEHIPFLGPMWSLAVEEQFYLLWPLALILLPLRLVVPALLGLIGLNVLISGGWIGGPAPVWGPLTFQLPNATYAPMLMGAAGAIIAHHPRGFATLWPVLGPRAAPLILAAALAAAIALTPWDLRGWPNLVIHSLMLALLLSLSLREDHLAAPLLGWAPLARIGAVSYGLYLYHLIALDLTARTGLTGWPLLIGYAALSWLVAEISFRTLEARFQTRRNDSAAPGGTAPKP
jgi:peptidoglycan/LPS O-acetylase OafA/YrhL